MFDRIAGLVLVGPSAGALGFQPWDMRKSVVELLRAKNDCSDWFNKGTSAQSAADIMSNVPILRSQGPSQEGAHTEGTSTSPIYVNDNGRFYSGCVGCTADEVGLVGGKYWPGSEGARMVILLHELAHKVNPPGMVDEPFTDLKGESSEKNTQQVMKNCSTAIDVHAASH